VPAAKTPAAFAGTPINLVIDALLGIPREDVDFSLSCTSLEKVQSEGDARDAAPSPGLPSPDKFEWIKHKHGPFAHITENPETLFDSDDSTYYAQLFDQRRKHHKTDRDTGHDHVRQSDRDDKRGYHRSDSNGNRDYGHSDRDDDRDAVDTPSQPPQPSNLTQLGGGSLFRILLTTADENLNGSLTQDDFKSWGKLSLSNQPA
jgi:hypothetical protein